MDDLTDREKQIASLVAEGLKAKEIAAQLGLSEQTIKNHKSAIYRKLGARNAVEMLLALETTA